MTQQTKRIAVNFGGGYVPGLNAVIAGTVRASSELGWEVFGIQDGYDGLLFPDRYPGGGLVRLNPGDVQELVGSDGCILGTAPRSDPFRVRTIVDSQVEELDRSDDVLARLAQEGIDGVVSVVGARSMSTLFRLHRKGLKTVCVPKSVQNDVAATMLSFGFNSALSFVTEMLQRCREAARSAHQIAVVEVTGEQTGWLALQSAIAVCADAVLIPEIRYDLDAVAAKLCLKARAGDTSGLVVVAEGARPVAGQEASVAPSAPKLKAMLSPGATGAEGFHVIYRSGQASEQRRPRAPAPDRPGDVPARARAAGESRNTDRGRSATGSGIRRWRRARPAAGTERSHGRVPTAGSQVRPACRGHQQSQDGARRERVAPDRAVPRHLPGGMTHGD